MLGFLYAEVNIVGAAVLLLMLTSRHKNIFRNKPFDQKIFNGVMFLNLLIFLFDTGMWVVDGSTIPMMRILNYVVTIVYYLLNPLICFAWLIYTDFKIYDNKSDLVRRIRFYIIPVILCTIITLLSPFTGWFFVINSSNHYIRGPWFLLMTSISLLYLVFACGISIRDILKNHGKTTSVNFSLIILPVFVIAATALQVAFFGISVIWICTMLSCTSIYINIQNTEISTDYLTGLYNRRRLDYHLQRRIQSRHVDRFLFALILDVDNFKRINDSYGHLEGDNTLIQTAKLLQKSCETNDDFIARLGGDEFIIVGERTTTDQINQLMNVIGQNIAAYNQNHPSAYTLTVSMGYAVFSQNDTQDSLLAAADQQMYLYKQNRKIKDF